MQSLKDKLLKAGLVTEEAAKKAESEKKAQAARPPPSHAQAPRRDHTPRPPPRDDQRFEASSKLPKFAPLAGSKEAHRQQAKKQLELDRAVREKVLETQVAPESGETPFYFVTRKNKLRRLELTPAQAAKLESGELAVVERPDPDRIEHALVPAAAAKELLALHPKVVRFLKAPDAAVGFLTETEIAARAHEAQSGETGEAHDEPQAEAATDATPEQASAEAPAAGETWITIKRAPRSE